MDSEIYFKGKKYISLKHASELTGYTSDYVGQLCRGKKINSRLVGRARYVAEDEILLYKDGPTKVATKLEKTKKDNNNFVNDISFSPESKSRSVEILRPTSKTISLEDSAPLFPELNKKVDFDSFRFIAFDTLEKGISKKVERSFFEKFILTSVVLLALVILVGAIFPNRIEIKNRTSSFFRSGVKQFASIPQGIGFPDRDLIVDLDRARYVAIEGNLDTANVLAIVPSGLQGVSRWMVEIGARVVRPWFEDYGTTVIVRKGNASSTVVVQGNANPAQSRTVYLPISNTSQKDYIDFKISELKDYFLVNANVNRFYVTRQNDAIVDLIGRSSGGSSGSSGGGTSNVDVLSDLSDITLGSLSFGDLLMYNGSSWVNIATTSLGISGVSQWNTVGSDIYYSTGKVGVGTTTPFSTLSVETSAGVSPFSVGSSTGSYLLIDKNGNVGVGTTTPQEKLQVTGNFFVDSTDSLASFKITPSSNNQIALLRNGNTSFTHRTFSNTTVQLPVYSLSHAGGTATAPTATLSNFNLGSIFFGGHTGSAFGTGATFGAVAENDWSPTSLSTSLIFSTNYNQSAGGLAERMRITASGNIAIGTTTALYNLTIASTTAPQIALSAGADIAQWALRNAGGNFYLATTTLDGVSTSSISALEIAGSGFGTTTLRGLNISGFATSTSNVGFNISSGCFAVNGTCISGGGGSASTTLLSDTNFFSGVNRFALASSTYHSFTTASSTNINTAYLTLSTSTVGTLKTNSSGLVWVDTSSGTSASSTLLGDSNTFSGTNNFTNKLGLASSTPWGQLSINPNALGSGVPEFVIGSSTATHFIVDGGGRVGVGTTNPTAGLNVFGNAKVNHNTAFANEFPLLVTQAGVTPEASTVTNSTVHPRAISIQGDGGAYFMGRDVTNDIEFIMGTSNQGAAFVGSMTAHDLHFRTGNATKLWIQHSTGNVGVATATPAYTLTVASSTAPQFSLSDGAGIAQWTFRNAGGNLYLSTTTVAGTATTSTSALTINGTTGGIFLATSTAGTLKTDSSGLLYIDTNSSSASTTLLSDANAFSGVNNFTNKLGLASSTPFAQLSINPNALGSGVPVFVIGSSTATHLLMNGAGNIGLAGQMNPQAPLDIWKSYSAGTDAFRISYNDGTSYFMGIQPYVVGTGNVGYKFRTNNDSTATESLSITGDGKIGIGENDPEMQLEVDGNVLLAPNSGNSLLYNRIPANTAYAQYLLQDQTSTSRGYFGYVGSSAGLGARNDTVELGSVGKDITFRPNDTEVMRLTSGGAIGIGTTTPTNNLTIASTTGAQLSLSAGGGIAQWAFRNAGGNFYLGTTTVAGTATSSLAALEIAGSGFGTTTVRGLNISAQATSTANIGFNITSGCYAVNGNCLSLAGAASTTLLTDSNTFSGANNFTGLINMTNKVGLASSTPWGLLSVNPDALGGNVPSFVVGSSTATRFIVANTGRVAVGNANPTTKAFEVKTTTDFDGALITSDQDNTQLTIRSTDTSGLGWNLNSTGGASGYGTGKFVITNSNSLTALMVIDSTGKVGIGRTDPGAALDVVGVSSDDLRLGGSFYYKIGRNTSTGYLEFEGTQGGFTGYNFKAGPFGINTSGADRKLDVLDTSGPQARLTYTDGSVYTDLLTNSLGQFSISPSGSGVGISTTTPYYNLTVASSTGPQFALSDSAGIAQWTFRNAGGNLYLSTTTVAGRATTTTSALTINGTTGGISLATSTAGTLKTNSSGLLYIDTSSGSSASSTLLSDSNTFSGINNFTANLGVGTSSPYAKLSVVGQVVAAYFTGTTTATSTFGGPVSINTTGPTASIYNPNDGAGVILRGYSSTGGGMVGQLRIVPNGGGWTDATTTTYFQVTNSNNNNATFMGGSYATDAPMNRLQFNASSTQFADALYDSTPAPFSLLGLVNNTAGKPILTMRGATAQAGDYLQVNTVSGSAGNVLKVNSAGNVGLASSTPWGLLSVNPSALGSGVPEFVIGSSTATHFIVNGAGNVGIGTLTPSSKLTVASTNLDTGVTFSNTNSTNATSNFGLYAYAENTHNSGSVVDVLGIEGDGINSGDGNVTNLMGVLGFASQGGVGTVSTMTSLAAYTNVRSGGTVTNNYGLLIQDQAGVGTNNYQIYSEGTAPSYFGGRISISTSTSYYGLTIASSTGPQLALSDGAGIAQWTQRNAGGNLYFATTTVVGTATTSISALEISGTGFGTTTVRGLNISAQATSTSNVGFNISTGCYAVNGTCIGGGAGSGTVNSGVFGQLAFYGANGTAVSGTSTITISTTTASGRVGIATTTNLNATLTLQGAAGTDILRVATTTSGANIITISEWGGFVQRVSSTTALSIQMASGTPVFEVDTTSNTNSGIDITAGTGQTSNLMNLYSSGGSFLAGFTSAGGLHMNISSSSAIDILNGSGVSAFMVDSSAKSVGIGTSTLTYNLNVEGSQASTYIARINNSSTNTSADGLLISLGVANASRTTSNYFIGFSDGAQTVAGKIQGGASAVAYTTSAADIAEYFRISNLTDKPKAGEIVVLDTNKSQSVVRSDVDTQIEPLGIVSTNPGFIGNAPICFVDDTECDKNYAEYNVLVALAGQVPLKVTNENGPVQIGDYLTLSKTVPGAAMKAVESGYIVGTAITNASSTLIASTTSVVALVRSGWREINNGALVNSTASSTPSKFASLFDFLRGVGLEIGENFVRITNLITEKLVAKKVETEELCIGDTCVNRDQLAALVQMSGVVSITENMETGTSTPEIIGTSTPPIITSTSTPAVATSTDPVMGTSTPEIISTSTPEVLPETSPSQGEVESVAPGGVVPEEASSTPEIISENI